MFNQEERCIFENNQLLEVICQLRFPDILKIEVNEPAEFQEAIRAEYPQYQKQAEQLPPRMENGRPIPQGTVNNYRFISADGGWKISLMKNFIALSTNRYECWEEFAKRLDRVLAAFIPTYAPAYFTRIGLRYINAFNRTALGVEEMSWRELIEPGYLGLMADDDVSERAFMKNEQQSTLSMPGGTSANIKCGPGRIRKLDKRTGKAEEASVFLLDIDQFMEGNTPINLITAGLNTVHMNAGSIFRGAITDRLYDAMGPRQN